MKINLVGYILFLSVKLTIVASLWLSPFKSYSQEYSFRNFTTENGLSQGQILSILQDNEGVIWFGTNDGGITKYDGNSFEYINTKNGLVDNVVFDICQYESDKFIIGTNNGISLIKGNKIFSYSADSLLESNRIFDIIKCSNSEILLGTGKGLAIYDGLRLKAKKTNSSLDSANVFKIYEDIKGNIWYSTLGQGLFIGVGSKIVHLNSEKGFNEKFIYSVFQKDTFNFWICTSGGLYNLDIKNNFSTSLLFSEVISNYKDIQFYSICKDDFQNHWITSSMGIYRYRNGEIEKINTENGLIHNNIWKVFIDKEKNIWFGSKENGVSLLSSYNWSRINLKKELSSNVINSVSKKDKELLLGTNSGVTVIKDDAFKSYSYANGHAIDIGYCAEKDNENNLWVGTTLGIIRFKNENFVTYEFDKKTKNEYNRCYDILIDKKNEIWFGTHGGIAKLINGKPQPLDFLGFSPKIIFDLYEDGNGTIWLGCEGGLFSYRNETIKRYTEKEGITEKRINCIAEDKNGVLWVSTNEGVFYFKDNKFNNLSEANGLSSNNAYSIAFDKQNNLWVGQPNGIDKVTLDNYVITKVKHYDGDNGFSGKECTDNSIYVDDSTGHIYIGTLNGLMIFRPEFDIEKNNAPNIIIKNINIFSQSTDWHEHTDSVNENGIPVNPELPFSKNYLTFNFVGISLSAPAKVKYQYMLKGIDKGWLPVTSKTEAIYNNLPPGNYEFLVKSCNENNIWSEPQSVSFKILPPFYRTWWFYSACAAIIVAGIFSYIKIRSANIKITKQSRIIAEKNKDLQTAYAEIEQTNKNITDSIRYAKRLQDAILPTEKYIRLQLPHSFVIYKPKDIVSGDFYWMVNKSGRILISAIDCTGHGVPGALVSIVGNNGLMRSVNEFGLVHPSGILDKLSSLVEETLRQNDEAEIRDGMDMALCMIEPENKRLEFSGANNPMYLVRSKGQGMLNVNNRDVLPVVSTESYNLFELKPDKQPIGAFEGRKKFTNHSVITEKGDSVYLFSDGYADQFGGPKGKKFLYKSLREILLSVQGKEMDEQRNIIEAAFENWRGNHEQVDDVCVIGVKI